MVENGTSATAQLVGTPADAGGRPDAATVTVARDEIQEALASDEPLELILSVKRETDMPKDVRVAWQRSDLEKVLADTDGDGITFSFDRAELYRALEHPDFEGHGIREMVMLTVAAASASAALAASTASGQLMEGTGGGGTAVAAAVAPGHDEATTARDLGAASVTSVGHDEATTARDLAAPARDEGTLASRGIDAGSLAPSHDEATLAARGVDQVVPAMDETTLAARGIEAPVAGVAHDEATTARDLATPAIHDETSLAARGVGQVVPGADETTLAARGIEQQPAPAAHDEATLVSRGIETPAVPADSGTSFELPSLDSGTAAAIGGLAGAGLLIVGATFAARRQRTTPA